MLKKCLNLVNKANLVVAVNYSEGERLMGWLTGWGCRKSHLILASAGAGTPWGMIMLAIVSVGSLAFSLINSMNVKGGS